MAGIHANELEQIKAFNWSGYYFEEERSLDKEYVFIRTAVPGKEKTVFHHAGEPVHAYGDSCRWQHFRGRTSVKSRG